MASWFFGKSAASGSSATWLYHWMFPLKTIELSRISFSKTPVDRLFVNWSDRNSPHPQPNKLNTLLKNGKTIIKMSLLNYFQ